LAIIVTRYLLPAFLDSTRASGQALAGQALAPGRAGGRALARQVSWAGGQAVIEGVMMRSPHTIAIAVRRLTGEILLRKSPHVPWVQRFKLWRLPIIRGGVTLVETLVIGIRALTYSGNVALEDQQGAQGETAQTGKRSKRGQKTLSLLQTTLVVGFSLTIGLFLFFYLPLLLTEALHIQSRIGFNLVDGGFRLLIFLLYLLLIAQWREIRRLFQYHGAEHKSIFTLENGLELTVENARPFSTRHPRCGTSFLLMVILVSIVVFTFLGRPVSVTDRFLRLLYVPLIAGISYELIRLSAHHANHPLLRLFVAPGLWLQRITTREPDEKQLEVALVALKGALNQEYSSEKNLNGRDV